MKHAFIFVWFLIGYLFFGGGVIDANTHEMGNGIIKIINFPRYEQLKDYNCGPAALLTIANFYEGDSEYPLTHEMEEIIENEAGTLAVASADQPAGTTPQQMKDWLTLKGFDADLKGEALDDEKGFGKIREKLEQGIPSILAWEEGGGHWAAVIGYDDKGSQTIKDDELIFSDPYDKYLGSPAWQTLITLSKKKSIKKPPVLPPRQKPAGLWQRLMDRITQYL